jgi:hypothetical protein
MRYTRVAFIALLLAAATLGWAAPNPGGEGSSVVIVFKNGRQQSFPVSDIARIEFKEPAAMAAASVSGMGRFLGKWRVGDGVGGKFIITLSRDGRARKSIGSPDGTWTVVDGEARISWDDGWHDVLRKVGNKYQKVAYSPGKSFSDPGDHAADAEHLEHESI